METLILFITIVAVLAVLFAFVAYGAAAVVAQPQHPRTHPVPLGWQRQAVAGRCRRCWRGLADRPVFRLTTTKPPDPAYRNSST